MKINNLDVTSSVRRTSTSEKKIKKSNTSSFMSSYSQAERDNEDEYIKKQLKDIDEKAELLKNRMDMMDFMEYKNIIKEFIAYIVKHSHEYSQESKMSRRGDFRVFGIIKRIDEELEKIANEFLKEKKDRLEIIKSISGIQGLLLDIAM